MKHAATRKMSRIQDIQLIFLSFRQGAFSENFCQASYRWICLLQPMAIQLQWLGKEWANKYSQTSLQALWEWPQSEAKENKMQLCQFVSVCPDDSSGFLARCWDCQIVFGKRKLILGTKSADYTIIHSSSLFSTCITCNMTNLSTASRKIVDQCVRTCFDARIQKRLTTSTRLSMLVGRKLLDPMST